MTPTEITRWVNSAEVGESIVYAVAENMAPNQAKRKAWELYEAGLVTLTQRRLAKDKIEYIAKRSNGTPALAPDLCVRCGAKLARYSSGNRCRKCQEKK